jgi:Tfp pilus assembly protein PilO
MRIDRPIVIAVSFFIAILLAYFLVFPEYKNFKSLQNELGIKKAQYNAEYEYFSAITKVYYEIKNRQEDIKKIDDALPTDPVLGKFVYYFYQKTAENGLVAKSLFLSKSSAKEQTGKVNNLTFSLNLIGGYSALENFLKSLEKSSRLLEVTSISFGSQSPSGSASQTQLQTQPQTQFQSDGVYSFNLEIKAHTY